MHLIHCHVKGYLTRLLPQIPHIGWLNGSTITWLVVANIFGHKTRYLARSQTAAVFFKVQFFPISFSLFILPIFSLNNKFDDVVIGHTSRDAQGLSIINNALKYVSEWSGQNGLDLNSNKCVQCTFSLKGNAVTDPLMTTYYPRLTQLLTLGLHLRETQSGPITLRESLENVCVYPFLQRNFEGCQHLLSIFTNLPRLA